MTESNWQAYCLGCGELIGPAHIDSEGGGSFYRRQGPDCKCACSREKVGVEIITLETANSRNSLEGCRFNADATFCYTHNCGKGHECVRETGCPHHYEGQLGTQYWSRTDRLRRER